jgi:hypothetical protein
VVATLHILAGLRITRTVRLIRRSPNGEASGPICWMRSLTADAAAHLLRAVDR